MQYDFVRERSAGKCMYGEVRCGAARERGEEQGCKIMSEKGHQNFREKMKE